MIQLENQVTSLELSKRLKKLGVKQDSLFAWYQGCGDVYCEYRVHQASRDAQSTYRDGYVKLPVEICAAFTVAELGEILKREHLPGWNEDFDEWRGHHDTHTVMHHKGTEADARAKMVIWLIENKLVEAKEDV